MKRMLCVILLLTGLLGSILQPVFAAERESMDPEISPTVPPIGEAAGTLEEAGEVGEIEETEELSPAVPEEEAAAPEAEETLPSAEAGETVASEEPVELVLGEEGPVEATPASVQTFTTSQAGVAFIEALSATDGRSYSIAQGESFVNSFIKNHSLQLNQQQFDALVDIAVCYGNIFSSSYSWWKVIASGSYTDSKLASAFCAWVSKNGAFSQERLNRRLREVKLFLYGSYDGVCAANFRYVVFNGNGGALRDNTVICYTLGEVYGSLPVAERSGFYFAGWFTAAEGGEQLYNGDTVTNNQRLYAHWSNTEVENPNGEDLGAEEWPPLPELKISEEGIAFIKRHEGFRAYPYWDYSQYTVGYGTRYDPSNSPIPISAPITEAEADYLLRYALADYEEIVDKQLQQATVTHSQSQYDVLVSITFNLGRQWINSNYNIYRYILHGGYTEMEFVNTLGNWCRAGNAILPGLVLRRVDEANLYLNGDYSYNSKAYLQLIFDGNGGESTDNYHYYKPGYPCGELPTATREGYTFTGWATQSGVVYTAQTIAPTGNSITLYAQWEEGETEDTEDPAPDPVPQQFADVPPSAWYYDYVQQAVELGLFSGVSDTRFNPEGTMTRGMLAAVLYRLAGQPQVTQSAPFTDVPEGEWYTEAVNWAYAKGVVNGTSETTFSPNSNITREQFTLMLYRYGTLSGYDCSRRGSLNDFSDGASVSDYAMEAMSWAVGVGILNGDGGKLNPQGSATRAQCAKMLVCYLEALS